MIPSESVQAVISAVAQGVMFLIEAYSNNAQLLENLILCGSICAFSHKGQIQANGSLDVDPQDGSNSNS